MRFLFFMLLILVSSSSVAQKFTVSGYVRDAETGETLIGVNLYIKGTGTGTISNPYGYYALQVPQGTYTIVSTYVGYNNWDTTLEVSNDVKLNINMPTATETLAEVIVQGEREDLNVSGLQIGTNKLEIASIKALPAFLGEVDVIKGIQLLPGVTTVGEGASGFNVRGGTVGENLILLDEAPIYNSSHLFGFFSVFNPDAVSDVKLVKGGVSAKYGGRLASILDIRMKEGNSKELSVEGGIGTIFSRLLVEAPIVKDKVSFVVAGRRSYIDILAKPFLEGDLAESIFNFYDLTAKINYTISDRHRLFLSSYFGRDNFDSDAAGFLFNWGNETATLRWNFLINDELFLNTTAYYSNYDYQLAFGNTDENRFDWLSRIINYSLKPDFTYYLNSNMEMSFGGQATFYEFKPGDARGVSDGEVNEFSLPSQFAMEYALYVTNQHKFNDIVSAEYGIRYSIFDYMGKGTAYTFGDRDPLTFRRPVIGQKEYDEFESIQSYGNWEPRLSLKFQTSRSSSIKMGYQRMAQYIQLVSNTAASSPLDIWTPSTNAIEPTIVDQISIGYFRNFKDNMYEASAEVYYKDMPNMVDYIPGANIILNPQLAGELLPSQGRAYGLELYLKKAKGKLTGWISYTLSRSEQKTEGINKDEYFPTRFDQPHNLKLVGMYQLSKRLMLSASFTYLAGTPATIGNSKFTTQSLGGIDVQQVTDNIRNNTRIPHYHRLDLSMNYKFKKKKRIQSELVVSVYNTYNRRNPFSLYLQPSSEALPDASTKTTNEAIQLSIVGSIIPSISYNFYF